ncbi:protein disulfide-isomerase domain [Kwoniella sp. DSM 27419]
MRLSATFALAAAVLPFTVQAGMYGQPVVNLDSKTFKKVMANEHAAMVAFVAPWCGHCKNLAPEYTSAASSLSPLIPFYAVDCDDQSNKPLCAEYGIKGFPTIKAFPKAGKGAAKDYNGERKRAALVEYAKTLVPDRVKKLRVEKEGKEAGVIQSFLDEKPTLPHVLLVHPSAPSIPFLWKVLAHRLSNKMHLGFVRDTTSHAVLSSLGVYDPDDTTRDATRVVSWPVGGAKDSLVDYEGGLKFNALLEWLQSQLDGTASPSAEKRTPKPKQTTESAQATAEPSQDKKASDAAVRRAKMDEAERRDRERRERAASKAKAAQDVADRSDDADGTAGEAGQGGTPVEAAPDAAPEGSVEDAAAMEEGVPPAAEPVPEQGLSHGVSEEARDTERVHEEL